MEFENATGGTPQSQQARRTGEAFLLERALYRRRSTGEPADPSFLQLLHPSRWRYDVLRGLDYFRRSSLASGGSFDPRLADAITHLSDRRLPDGRWPLDWRAAGRTWFELDDGPGLPSRWVTLKALRILDWAARAGDS